MTIGNGSIPLRLGNLINTEVYGGPYRNCPQVMFGVKMAAEIALDCDVDVPTVDFSVPEVSDLRLGVMKALMHLSVSDTPVYVGCMGGIGRTGLFLAALAKVQIEYRKTKHRKGGGDDPVAYVREHFIPHAVETEQQKQYIADFDVSDIVEWIDVTQRAMGLVAGFQPQPVQIMGHQHKAGMADETWVAGLVERDLDWIDALDADSLSEAEEGDISDEQMADIYETLDEHEASLESHHKLLDSTAIVLGLLKRRIETLENQDLTKPTLFERIRGWFK